MKNEDEEMLMDQNKMHDQMMISENEIDASKVPTTSKSGTDTIKCAVIKTSTRQVCSYI